MEVKIDIERGRESNNGGDSEKEKARVREAMSNERILKYIVQ